MEGKDEAQPNPSWSKKLKGYMPDLLLVRDKYVWSEGKLGIPFSAHAELLELSMSRTTWEACS